MSIKSGIQKSFGGLSRQYYIRQFLFSLIFPAIFFFVISQAENYQGVPPSLIVMFAINCLLYPYSRYVYESVVNYILGDNVLFGSVFIVVIAKYITMAICYMFAMFIAPIGLIYLFFYHNKNKTFK